MEKYLIGKDSIGTVKYGNFAVCIIRCYNDEN